MARPIRRSLLLTGAAEGLGAEHRRDLCPGGPRRRRSLPHAPMPRSISTRSRRASGRQLHPSHLRYHAAGRRRRRSATACRSDRRARTQRACAGDQALRTDDRERVRASLARRLPRRDAVGAVCPSAYDRARQGTIILTGATAGCAGPRNFSAFASAKFALRGLAQSLAREFGPKGVHVAHVVLDGLIDEAQTDQRFGIAPSGRMEPDRAYLSRSRNAASVGLDPRDGPAPVLRTLLRRPAMSNELVNADFTQRVS